MEVRTLKDLVEFGNDKNLNSTAFIERRNNEIGYIKYTYQDVKEDVKDLATALIEKHNLKGKKIAVIGENSYKWMMSYLAVTSCVGVIVPLDRELPANEIVNLLEQSDAEAIFYSSKKRDVIESIKELLPDVKVFIEMYSEEESGEPLDTTYEVLIKEGRELRLGGNRVFEKTKIDDGEFRVLIYTSGTTSAAKGVMLSHKNLINNAVCAKKLVPPIGKKDTFFSVLPMHHTYEMAATYIWGMYVGSCIGICQGLKYLSPNMEEYKPTILTAVPLLLDKVMRKVEKGITEQGKTETVKKAKKVTTNLSKLGINVKRTVFKSIHEKLGGRLKYILSGSAPIDPELINKYEEIGIAVVQGFGLTEAAPLICGNYLRSRNPATVGKAAKGMEVKLFNVNEDGVGELITRGDNVMLGYYKNPKKTAEVIKDGWLHTEDLAYKDKRGDYVICGRSKNLIVTKNGKKIFPEELEALVNNIPEVKESLVYEKENKEDVTNPMVAVIVAIDEEHLKEKYGKKRPTNEALQEKIWKDIKDINRTLVSYKAIRNLKIKEGEFEKTTTLKIKRFIEMEEIKKQNHKK